MKESQKTAEKYYSGLGKGSSCTSTSELGNVNNFKQMTDAVQAGGGAIIYKAGSARCFVSADILVNPKDKNTKVIRFAPPEDVRDQSRPLDFILSGLPTSIKLADASGGKAGLCGLTDQCADADTHRFLYPNAGICSQASTPVPASKGKGTSQ
jgi:hypothetical protein